MIRAIALLLLLAFSLNAETVQIPTVNLTLGGVTEPEQLVNSLNVLVVLTLLFLAPSLILVMTSFTRILIVFGFLRQALGTQQMPPTQLLVSLALVLSFFVMEPVGEKAYEKGVKPYLEKTIGYEEAFEKASEPFKNFMIRNTREKDLALFFRIRNMQNPQSVKEVPLSIVIPAFMIS